NWKGRAADQCAFGEPAREVAGRTCRVSPGAGSGFPTARVSLRRNAACHHRYCPEFRVMADKTEQPTPKRLNEARKKGQVAKSNDLTQAFLFMTGVGVISAGGSYYVAELLNLIRESFQPERLTGQLPLDQVL